MSKTWLVFRQEIIRTMWRKSFILTLILVPLIGSLVTFGASLLGQRDSGTNILTELFVPQATTLPEGYVDPAGFIQKIPEDLAGALIRYDSEPAALQAVDAGVIAGYYVISPNYLRSGGVTYYRKNYDPMGGMDQAGVIVQALDYNILQDDPQLLARYNNTLVVEEKILSPEPQRDPANMLTFFLPYGVTMLFYFMILGSSSLMLSSINKERENRVLEVLMTSVNPMQMLTGKILALGVAGLTQTVVWVGVALLLLRFSGTAFNLGAAFQLPASFLVWGVIFFLLGYALYAAMMASVGALVSNVKEGGSITTLIILPLIVPLVFISGLVQNPNDGISVALSLIPFTSPVSMMTRISATSVPWWQLLLSIALLIMTVYLVLRVVASLFRAQNMLSGQPLTIKRYLMALVGK
jgi:ABC-2 type transport system permease protein